MTNQNPITEPFQMASNTAHHRPYQEVFTAASRDVLRQKFGELVGKAEQFVATHPGMCFGAAVAAGVILGWLIKRK